MFDGRYFNWNEKRIKNIVDFYGYKFFYFKKVLDLGCGYGDLGGVLYRLGSAVTGVDARQDHLKILSKKFTGIKTVQSNLDVQWPFHGQKFDLILDLGLLCHLANYEKHLAQVCASTTHLVLETAVCDSDDPHKCVEINEDKGIYDLSYNGKGCRPSAAAIERVLKESGMNFKRIDNSKFNSGEYSYDWYAKNDNSVNINKRRIWFVVKDNSPIQFANPNSEIAYPPITVESLTPSVTSSVAASQGYITPIINSGVPAKIISFPKDQVMTSHMELEAKSHADAIRDFASRKNAPFTTNNVDKSPITNITYPEPSPIKTYHGNINTNDKVRRDSREFALITPDDFQVSLTNQLAKIILPTTISSKMWYKKIFPLFPNFRLGKNVINMPGFSKSEVVPDLVMCGIDNLQSFSRIWIDEWFGFALTDIHLEILKKCHTIITPSLLNAQEIWKHIPHANILRMDKPWVAIDVPAAEGNYFLYFEKSSNLTNDLLNTWDPKWGNLVVVNSSIKLPAYATYVADHESYVQIMKYLMGCKGLIDLSENNYYCSGLMELAINLNIPVISNNQNKLSNASPNNFMLINQDKRISNTINADNIKEAMNKFTGNKYSTLDRSNIDKHNRCIVENIIKMMGGK